MRRVRERYAMFVRCSTANERYTLYKIRFVQCIVVAAAASPAGVRRKRQNMECALLEGYASATMRYAAAAASIVLRNNQREHGFVVNAARCCARTMPVAEEVLRLSFFFFFFRYAFPLKNSDAHLLGTTPGIVVFAASC